MRHIHSTSNDSLTTFQSSLLNKLSDSAFDNIIFITDADPIGANKFDVLISDMCVLFAQTVQLDEVDKYKALVPKIPALLNGIQTAVYSKLSTHRGLTYRENSDIKVKMPFIVKFIFPEINPDDIDGVDDSVLQSCIFKGQEDKLLDLLDGADIGNSVQYPYKKDFVSISEGEKNLLVLVIAPEYTNAIPNDNRFSKVEAAVSVDKPFENAYKIKEGDVYANAFCLDPEQIEIVNRITPGHWLIVSPAGSGKSVIALRHVCPYHQIIHGTKILKTTGFGLAYCMSGTDYLSCSTKMNGENSYRS